MRTLLLFTYFTSKYFSKNVICYPFQSNRKRQFIKNKREKVYNLNKIIHFIHKDRLYILLHLLLLWDTSGISFPKGKTTEKAFSSPQIKNLHAHQMLSPSPKPLWLRDLHPKTKGVVVVLVCFIVLGSFLEEKERKARQPNKHSSGSDKILPSTYKSSLD